MHANAYAWVARCVYELGDALDKCYVIDLGGADRNPGAPHVRNLFTGAKLYTVVDVADELDVDVVADVTAPFPWPGFPFDSTSTLLYDVVICTEVFEHVAGWRSILTNAAALLRNGGALIATCAGPGRPPHSMSDTGDPELDEHYAGVSRAEVHDELVVAGVWGTWGDPVVTGDFDDTYVVARRANRSAPA